MDPLLASASPFELTDFNAYRSAPDIHGQGPEAVRQAAQEFETFFLTQFIETIQSGISTEAPFGGGAGERAFRSFLSEEHARAVVNSGGVGIADRLYRDIIALQSEEAA